jgi:MOSC domain-containing protein YiiM
MSHLSGLYAGRAAVLEPQGVRSAILKAPVARARATRLGLVGDEQADRRYHGGPDQALHQFAQRSYRRLVAAFPALADSALPGSVGENLSDPALDEDSVCIGDRYRIGEVEVEVSQPRRPCSKLDDRFGVRGLAAFVHGARMPGWYLRVLREGELAVGDAIELVARPTPAVSIARLLAILAPHRPVPAELELLLDCAALGADWRRRIRERLAFVSGAVDRRVPGR